MRTTTNDFVPEADYLEYKRWMFNQICQSLAIPPHILNSKDTNYSGLFSRRLAETACRELIRLPDYELRGFEF